MRDEEVARARARWAIGKAWEGDAAQALSTLQLVTDGMVREFGRDTVVRSAGANKRVYARVPSGNDPGSFCLTLSSWGFACDSMHYAGEMVEVHGDGGW